MNSRAPHDTGPPLASQANPARAETRPELVVIDRAGIHGLALCDMLTKTGFACRLGRTSEDAIASSAIIAVIDDAIEDQIAGIRAHSGPEPPVVAVLRHPGAAAYARAIVAGADGIAVYGCSTGDLIHTVRAAAAKRVLLPADVARELARSHAGSPVVLTARELRWLRAMKRGDPLATIAEREGCSTSEIATPLQQLYGRIGVSRRSEALDRLTALGLLS